MVRVPLHQLVPRDSASDRLSRVLQAESRIVGASANVTPAAASACAPVVIASTATRAGSKYSAAAVAVASATSFTAPFTTARLVCLPH